MTEPIEKTSYVRFCPATDIQARGLDPLTITGLFLKDLREHFQPGQIENPRLADLVWVPRADDPNRVDDTRTRIMIEPFGYDRKESAGSHPTLVVKRGEQDGSRRLGIGSNAYHGDWAASKPPLAGTEYTNMIQGSHQVMCATDSAGVSELLAWEVYRQLAHFSVQWCRHYGFGSFTVAGLSAQEKVKIEQFEHTVAVNIGYEYTDNWVVAEAAPRLSRFITQLAVRPL
jgi:hypothetical protein